MQPKRRIGALALVSILALALLPRLCVLLAPRVDLFGPPDPGEPSIHVGEELTRGSIAVEFLKGPLLSPLDYQYAKFFGGSLVVEILAVPLFAVFGARLWALKAVPILFHLGAVALVVLLLDRFATRRAAWLGGILMALTPPGYTLVSTVAWGSHLESNTLALLAGYLFLDLCAATGGRGWRRALLGAVMGFSIWFGYQCLVWIVAILTLDLLRDRRAFFGKELLLQAAGLAAGLVPWLAYNLRYDFAGLSIYGSSILAHLAPSASREGPLRRLAALFLEGLPASFFFKPWLGLSPTVLGTIEACVLAAGTLAGAAAVRPFRWIRERQPPNPGLLALAVLLVYLAAVAFSDFQIPKAAPHIQQIRYVMLMMPFLFLATAVGFDAIASRGPALRAAVSGILGLYLAISVLGVLLYCDASRFGADRDATAAPEDGMGRWFAWRFGDDPRRLERIVEQAGRKRTPAEQEVLYESMGRFLHFMTKPGRKMSAWDEAHVEGYVRGKELLRSSVPEAYRRHFE